MIIEPQLLFGWAGNLIAVLWLALIASLYFRRLQLVVETIGFLVLPVVFGVFYVLAMAPHMPFAEGGFGSLAAVRTLFAHDDLLLAGWLHFLVFDYFVGVWIARDRIDEPVWRILVLPCLLLCFLAGPTGLLAWLIIRTLGRWRLGRLQAAA